MPTDGKKRPCEVDHLHIDTRLGDHEHRAPAPTGRRAADGAGAFPTARRVPTVGGARQPALWSRGEYVAAERARTREVGLAETAQLERFLDAREQRVVVVGLFAHRARLD